MCGLVFISHCSNIKMSEAIEDPHAYTRLTDFILQQIMISTDKNLTEVCVPCMVVFILCMHCVHHVH